MEELVMVSWSIFAKTLTFCIGAISVHYMLRYYDKRNGVDWGKNYEQLLQNPMGIALYFGARVVAVTGLAGAIYS